MTTHNARPLWQRWLSAITTLVMVLGMFPFVAQSVSAADPLPPGLMRRLGEFQALTSRGPLAPTVITSLTWTDGRPADLVLGQLDFANSTAVTSQTNMRATHAIAVDPTTGKVFVADNESHRVLRFASAEALLNGAAAEGVLGQADFTSGNPNRGVGVGPNTLNSPAGVYVDSAGRLWVADALNNRVLRFDEAAAKANGANADGVLGQIDMHTMDSNTTQNTLYTPRAVFVDAAGRLWVADFDNSRVLRFDDAANLLAGANANGVLGQADFVSGSANRGGSVAANTMQYPAGLIGSANGALFVADMLNNRVLRYDNAAGKADGAAADGVLGQADFVSGSANRGGSVAANTLNEPYGVVLDPAGKLFLADQYNHRILIFNGAANKANGADADNVLGQEVFTTNTANSGGLSAYTLDRPLLLGYDPDVQVLWAADSANNRVLAYGYGVTVNYDGPGSGVVNRDPNQMLFRANSDVLLSPQSDSGSAFLTWSGDCVGTGDCVLQLDSHKEVTATFVLATLELTKTVEDVNGAPLYIGDYLRYTILVTNTSVVTHTNVVVTDTLPVGVSFASATPAGYSGPNPLVWDVGTLAPDAVWQGEILVYVNGDANPIGGNVVIVSSDYIDEQSSDPVLPPDGGDIEPGLVLDKTAEDLNGAPLYVGDVIRYTIRVTNTATTDMTGVVVTDTLPAGVSFNSATPSGYTGPNPLVWNVGTLASGASWTGVILVHVDGSVNPIGGNVAEVSSNEQGAHPTDPTLPPSGGDVTFHIIFLPLVFNNYPPLK